MGAYPPHRSWKFFKVYSDSEQYAICDDLWLCSVEYLACVFGFWGLCPDPHRSSVPGPHSETSIPRHPLLSPPQQIPGYAPDLASPVDW